MTTPQDPFSSPPEGSTPAYGSSGPPAHPGQQSGTSGLAIAALICAILVPIVGLILGFVAKSQINKTGQGGGGLATAAIVISGIFIALGVLAFFAAVSLA